MTPPALTQLLAKLENQTAVVGVIGLGYVGLPLIRAFVDAGYATMGFDVDESKIRRLQAGESYIRHIGGEWIGPAVQAGRFLPTADCRRLGEPDALVICVPTPLTESRDPDLQFVEQTARQIAAQLRSGQLVVLESTTYPGTTREILEPALRGAGQQLESSYFLAYSPEREDPGQAGHTARDIPKVVGAAGPHSLQAALALYQRVTSTVPVSSCEVAEASKLLENIYRSVNIAMVNELKTVFDRLGLDIWEVIAAASTKPFGFHPFYPGPGLGGHCIPIDPFYLSWLARRHNMAARFVELAGEVNSRMPAYVVQRLAEALNDRSLPLRGRRIAILGVAYKANVDDPRESPAFRIMELLTERGAVLSYSDPHIPTLPAMRSFRVPPLRSEPLTAEFLERQDAVVVVTQHDGFDWQLVADHAPLVVDTRNAMHNVAGPAVVVKA